MALGRKRAKQTSMWVAGTKLQRGPRHAFYERLESLLVGAEFDRRVEGWCSPYYEAAGQPGRPSVPPGVYFRMLLVGYFEGIEAERAIAWRCADSLSLKSFLGYEPHERTPDHSTLSRTRDRLGEEVYERVFELVLEVLRDAGLVKGRTLAVDATQLRADASMRTIIRRDTGEGYREYLRKLAEDEGLEAPTDEDLRRMDRYRKGKKTSNKDWESPTDPDARIARLKDGRTRMAHKAEHVVDLETGAVVHADLLPADTADSASLKQSLDAAKETLDRLDDDDDGTPPTTKTPRRRPKLRRRKKKLKGKRRVVTDKGYFKTSVLQELDEEGWQTYMPEQKQRGRRRWKRYGEAAKQAVYRNRRRVRGKHGRALQRLRGERVERVFAHVCETGGSRRLRLRGRANARKRYLIQVAGANLGLLMRTQFGAGTPRGWAARGRRAAAAVLALLIATLDTVAAGIPGLDQTPRASSIDDYRAVCPRFASHRA